jgi:hypothetical protein
VKIGNMELACDLKKNVNKIHAFSEVSEIALFTLF